MLAGCTSTEPISGQKIDGSYSVGGIRWQSGAVVYVVARTFEIDGKVGVCGAWWFEGQDAYTKQVSNQVMDAGSVLLDGNTVVSGLGFMNRVVAADEMAGKPTSCVRTSADWKKSYEGMRPKINFPRMTFNF